MAGPRNCERFIVSLSLSLCACSFDGVGLGQTGEGGTSGGSSGESASSVSSTGAPPTGVPTTDEPTSVGPAGEMSASDGTGPVTPDTTTSEPGTTTDSLSTTSTGEDTSTGSTSTGCELVMVYEDGDGDGFGDPNSVQELCEAPDGYVDNGDDCNDKDQAVSPDGKELCDGADNDCDGIKDDFDPTSNTDCGDCKMYLYVPNNRVYLFCDAVKNWAGAGTECDKRDAKLAKDLDGAHHTWLLTQLPSGSGPWWIGGTAPNSDDSFKWTIDDSDVPDGDDPRWANFRPLGGGKDRMVLVSNGNGDPVWGTNNGRWFDREDKDNQPYICERAFTP